VGCAASVKLMFERKAIVSGIENLND